MKCPICGASNLVQDTRDQPYTYKGKTTILKAITGKYCMACDESITDLAETERIMAMMRAFKKQVDYHLKKQRFGAEK